MKNPHMMLVALDPPIRARPKIYGLCDAVDLGYGHHGSPCSYCGHVEPPERRWRCRYCGIEGLMDNVRAVECSYVYPPCPYCGQSPECAIDCEGIAKALAGEDVYIAGLPPPTGKPS